MFTTTIMVPLLSLCSHQSISVNTALRFMFSLHTYIRSNLLMEMLLDPKHIGENLLLVRSSASVSHTALCCPTESNRCSSLFCPFILHSAVTDLLNGTQTLSNCRLLWSDNRKLPSLKKNCKPLMANAIDSDARIAVSASHGTATTVQYPHQIIMPPSP